MMNCLSLRMHACWPAGRATKFCILVLVLLIARFALASRFVLASSSDR
jgi:hypothetical protein